MNNKHPKFRADPRFSDQSRSRPRPSTARRASPKPRKALGPAVVPPKDPTSRKQRRRMLKAAAWRLAKMLRFRPAMLLSMQDTAMRDLIEARFGGSKGHGKERDRALQLLKKMGRLRWKPA